MDLLYYIKVPVDCLLPLMLGNHFMMMTTNSPFEPGNYKEKYNMAMTSTKNPYDTWNFREFDSINNIYKVQDPTGVVRSTGGRYNPNHDYGKQPFFANASKFLSLERDDGVDMPDNMHADQKLFWMDMRKYHFENVDPKTMNKKPFDNNTHSYNTNNFITWLHKQRP